MDKYYPGFKTTIVDIHLNISRVIRYHHILAVTITRGHSNDLDIIPTVLSRTRRLCYTYN